MSRHCTATVLLLILLTIHANAATIPATPKTKIKKGNGGTRS